MKLAALALVIAALGLPLNDLPRFALLVVAAVLVFTGRVSTNGRRWLVAGALAAVCLLAQVTLPFPRIEEGHNVFLVDRPGGALEAGLPPQAYRLMLAEFDARYPPAQRCDPATDGCWRGQGFPDRAFAFSADGIFGRPAFSRRVSGIDFADPVWLRIGFINENRYNWNSLVSDVQRASRDRHATGAAAPLAPRDAVVRDVPLPGGLRRQRAVLARRGAVGRRGRAVRDDPARRHGMPDAHRGGHRTEHLRRRDPQRPAARHAARSDRQSAGVADAGDGAAADRRGGGADCCWRDGGRAARSCRSRSSPSRLVVVFFNDPSFIGGVRPFDSGDDGLVYDGYARSMLQYLLAGDIYNALRGQESVFYFTPGMRYLRAFEHVIFGESYLGYLALMMFLPMLVFWLFRRFLPVRWALALALTFAAIPIGVLFGSSLVLYVKWAARGFGDPAAYVCFLAGFLLLVGRAGERARAIASRRPAARACCSRWRCSCGRTLRHAPASCWPAPGLRRCGRCNFAASPACASASCRCSGWRCTTGSMAACSCCSPPAPRSRSRCRRLPMWRPSRNCCGLNSAASTSRMRCIRSARGWPGRRNSSSWRRCTSRRLRCWCGWWCGDGSDPWLRLTAVATLTQHGVNLFFLTYGRYYYLTWLLTLLVVAVWVHDEGIALARRRFPALAEWIARLARRPACVALTRGLDRIARDWEEIGAHAVSS